MSLADLVDILSFYVFSQFGAGLSQPPYVLMKKTFLVSGKGSLFLFFY